MPTPPPPGCGKVLPDRAATAKMAVSAEQQEGHGAEQSRHPPSNGPVAVAAADRAEAALLMVDGVAAVTGGVDAAPFWLTRWQAEGLAPAAARARFDDLIGVAPEAMIGQWRGRSLATGHPFDGLLEAAGWYGKAMDSVECVHPLLFRRSTGPPIALDPALLPVGLALRLPALARNRLLSAVVARGLPLLRTHRPAARLRSVAFRGKASTAMVYDRQPITDHFRRIDSDRVLGLMVYRPRPLPYFFFCLERDSAAPPVAGSAGK